MSETPKVSIIIPVYNGGCYFEQAVESALAQSYSNIEILIVNDGSTDNGHTDAIGRRFQLQFPNRIRYFYQKNAGVAGALNTGIENMLGDYFCWLSHDDLYLNTKVEKQISLINSCADHNILLFGDWEYIDPEGNTLYPVILDGDYIKDPSVAPVLGGAMNGCTVMVSRASLGSFRFDPQYRCVQDYRLWFELAKHTTFVRHPEILVRQRLHPGQDTNRLKDIAIREGESLWQDMIFGTSTVLRAAIDGSSFRFLNRMAQRLTQMPYPEACARVTEAAEKSLEAANISIIMVGDIASERFAQYYSSSRREENIQFLAVGAGRYAEISKISAEFVSDIYAALNICNGEYISIVHSSDDFVPTNLLEEQAKSMSRSGKLVSIRRDHHEQGNLTAASLSIHTTPRLSTVMVHRYLVAAGEFDSRDIDDQLSASYLRILSMYSPLVVGPQGREIVQ